MMSPRRLALVAGASLTALIFLCLAWELWIAPLRPGGSWLALKSLPLLAPLFGVLQGKRYTYQWSSMLVLTYAAEGVVRAATESAAFRLLAVMEVVLSLVFFASAILYVRVTRAA